jgi:hypothetical protein
VEVHQQRLIKVVAEMVVQMQPELLEQQTLEVVVVVAV